MFMTIINVMYSNTMMHHDVETLGQNGLVKIVKSHLQQ